MSELKHTNFMQGLKILLPEYLAKQFHGYKLGETRWFFQVYYGTNRNIHYEVSRPVARQGRMLEIGLHFESRDRNVNANLLENFARYVLEIRAALGNQIVAEGWDRGWTKVYEAYPNEALTADTQQFAAQRLANFIATVQPLYEQICKGIE